MKRKKHPRVLTLSILTTLTVLTWVAFEVWHAFTKQPPAQVDSKILEAIDPRLDTETLQKIKSKLYFPDEEARRGLLPTGSPEASPTPIQSGPTASPSVNASPTPAAGGSQ